MLNAFESVQLDAKPAIKMNTKKDTKKNTKKNTMKKTMGDIKKDNTLSIYEDIKPNINNDSKPDINNNTMIEMFSIIENCVYGYNSWEKRQMIWIFWKSHVSELCEKWICRDGNYSYTTFY